MATMKKRLWVSFGLLLPLMYIAMGHMWGWPLPHIFHNGLVLAAAELALTIPIIIVNFGYYSRGFTVRGTKGMYVEENHSLFLDNTHPEECHWNWRPKWGNADEYLEKYEHPVWREYLEKGICGGHGGMDGLVYGKFVECCLKGEPMPIDVYDAAAWMAVTPLSAESIRNGSTAVEFPDFTEGKWKNR